MAKVVYEFSVYKNAEEKIDAFLASLDSQNYDKMSPSDMRDGMGVMLMADMFAEYNGEKSIITKLPKKEDDHFATYKIEAIDILDKAFNHLNTFGMASGPEEKGFLYKSIIIKEFHGQKVDFGVIDGKPYRDGQMLEGPQTYEM